jgi:hypothetical protein
MAHQRLRTLLPIAGPTLVHLRNHPDAEIASRVSHLYEEWAWQVADNIRPSNWPYTPWIDSLPKEYPERSYAIDLYLATVATKPGLAGNGPPHWNNYRTATKRFIVTLLLEEASVEDVRRLLDTMAKYEKAWIKNHQHSYQFPKAMLAACD